MHLTIRVLGVELLHLELGDDSDDDSKQPLDYTGSPVGFTPSPGDQRWRETEAPDLQ